MKKIMTLVVAVCAVVASQAASFKWTAANIYDSSLTSKYTGTAEIYAYLTSGSVADAVKVTDAYVIGGTLKSDAAGTATGFTYNWTDAVANSSYTFYMVIEDGDKTFNSYEAGKTVAAIAAATSTPSVAFANMTSYTQSAANWTAVPEPTSGLLLLLGMAGLALKRKQA